MFSLYSYWHTKVYSRGTCDVDAKIDEETLQAHFFEVNPSLASRDKWMPEKPMRAIFLKSALTIR